MIEEYVIAKILEIREKEGNTSRSIVNLCVEGRTETSEHFKKYADMFKSGDEVICVWRPEFKKITQMWFPNLWVKIAKQIEPYPTVLLKTKSKKGKTYWRKARKDLLEKKEQKKIKVSNLIMY
jgi:hypothetical protein